jgi:hypothetical protein
MFQITQIILVLVQSTMQSMFHGAVLWKPVEYVVGYVAVLKEKWVGPETKVRKRYYGTWEHW